MSPHRGIQRVLGYTTSVLFLGIGVLLMSGILVPSGSVKFRILFGLVVFLYGAFRFVMIRTQSHKRQE